MKNDFDMFNPFSEHTFNDPYFNPSYPSPQQQTFPSTTVQSQTGSAFNVVQSNPSFNAPYSVGGKNLHYLYRLQFTITFCLSLQYGLSV